MVPYMYVPSQWNVITSTALAAVDRTGGVPPGNLKIVPYANVLPPVENCVILRTYDPTTKFVGFDRVADVTEVNANVAAAPSDMSQSMVIPLVRACWVVGGLTSNGTGPHVLSPRNTTVLEGVPVPSVVKSMVSAIGSC